MTYWQKRFKELESASHQLSIDAFRDIVKVFRNAQYTLQKDVDAWYGRFAKNNDMTMTEARKLLTTLELDEFRWSVERYIEVGRENAINQKWLKQLENASTKYHISRMTALTVRIQQAVELVFKLQHDIVERMANDIVDNTYTSALKLLSDRVKESPIKNRRLKYALSKPWASDGLNFSERIWKNRSKLIDDLHKGFTRNIILGKNPDNLIKEISHKFKVAKCNAKRLIMTESTYLHTASKFEAFNDTGVQFYEIYSIIDSKTSDICMEFDGKVFETKDMQIGINAPPFHPNCRSLVVPYFDDY